MKLNQPDWGPVSHSLAFSAELAKQGLAASHPECILGASRFRAAAGDERAGTMAAVDRYRTGSAAWKLSNGIPRHRSPVEHIAPVPRSVVVLIAVGNEGVVLAAGRTAM